MKYHFVRPVHLRFIQLYKPESLDQIDFENKHREPTDF